MMVFNPITGPDMAYSTSVNEPEESPNQLINPLEVDNPADFMPDFSGGSRKTMTSPKKKLTLFGKLAYGVRQKKLPLNLAKVPWTFLRAKMGNLI